MEIVTLKRSLGFLKVGAALLACAGLLTLIALPLSKAKGSVQKARFGLEELEQDGAAEFAAWRAIGQRDEFGRIDPDGLKKGLAQRNALIAFNAKYKNAKWSGGWTLVGSTTQAGRTLNMAIDPTNTNVMYAATAGGGLWKSTDAGAHWKLASDRWGSIATSVVTLDPHDHTKVWVGTGEWTYNSDAIEGDGIYVSSDSGATYSKLPASAGWDRISSISFDPTNSNNILVGVTSVRGNARGVFRSTDGGATFTQTFSASGFFTSDVQLDSTGTRAIMISFGSDNLFHAYFSNNGGVDWYETGYFSAVPFTARPTLQFAPGNNSIVYLIQGPTSTYAKGLVYKSTDYGQTYTTLPAPAIAIKGNQSWYNNPIWIDPTNPNRIVNGDVSNYMSTDGGSTWTQISDWAEHYNADDYPHADVHQIVNDPGYDGVNNKKVYFCTDGGIFVKDDITVVDYHAGWHTLQYNQPSMQAYGASGNSLGNVISGLQDNGVAYNASGNQASVLVVGGDGGFCASDVTDPNFQYGAFPRGYLYQTKDNWTTADYIYAGMSVVGSTAYNFITPFTLSQNNPNVIYTGGRYLYRRTAVKTGGSFQLVSAPISSSPISAIAIAPGNDNIVVYGKNDGVLTKYDGSATTTLDGNGGSWPNPLPNRAINRILILDSSATSFIVALGGFSADNLQKTTNGGTSFVSISGSGPTALPSVPIRAIAVNPNDSNNIFVGTEVGIFKSDDGGATWSTSNFGPSNVCTYDLQWMAGSSTKLIAATHGRGTWLLNVATGVRPDSLTVNKPNSVGGNKLRGTVTLNETADTGGQAVTLSSDQAIPDLPASVTVPAGQTTVSFDFTPSGVDSTQNYSIHATSAGVTVDAPLSISPASLFKVGVSPSQVFTTGSATATVYLTGAAGPSGFSATLDDGTGSGSQSIAFASQESRKSVTLTAPSVTTTTTYTATVTGTGGPVTTNWVVKAFTLSSLTLTPNTVVGGNLVSALVKIPGKAPVGGLTVSLSCDSSVNLPATVTIPAGQSSAAVGFRPGGVDSTVNAVVTATLNGSALTQGLTVRNASIASAAFAPSSVTGGQPSSLRLMLDGNPGPAGLLVTLAPRDSSVVLPGTVTIPSSARTYSVAATTTGVGSDLNVQTDVSAAGSVFTPTLTVRQAVAVSATPSATSVLGGKKVYVTVRLNGKAGSGGTTFSVSSSSGFATAPASVTVPSGASSATFAVQTQSTGSVSTPVTITCAGSGGVGTVSASFTIN